MTSPCGAKCEVGDLANLVVAEVVGVSASLAHDTAVPELVQTANQRIFAGVARISEDIRCELTADRRSKTYQVPGRLGQLREVVLDNGLHFRTDLFPVAVRAPAGA